MTTNVQRHSARFKKYRLSSDLVSEYTDQESDYCTWLNLYEGKEWPDIWASNVAGSEVTSEERKRDFLSLEAARAAIQSWINHDCPTYFLERDLAEALVRTDVLPNLTLDDLHLPWESFRVFLPSDLVSYHFTGPSYLIDSLLITKSDVGVGAQVIFMHHDPTDAGKFGVVGAYLDNNDLVGDGRTLVANILVFLGTLPEQEEREIEIVPARTFRQNGKDHSLPALFEARWIGRQTTFVNRPPRADGAPTGKHIAAHWRRGHFKRQPYGPLRLQRKISWIGPYHVGNHEDALKV
jgi:hypothetical protein